MNYTMHIMFGLILFAGMVSSSAIAQMSIPQLTVEGYPVDDNIQSSAELNPTTVLETSTLSDENDDQDCICTPYHMCKSHTPDYEGHALINIRINIAPCQSYLDVCCNDTKITSTEKSSPEDYSKEPSIDQIAINNNPSEGQTDDSSKIPFIDQKGNFTTEPNVSVSEDNSESAGQTDNSAEKPSAGQTDSSAEIPSNNQTDNSAEIPSDGQTDNSAEKLSNNKTDNSAEIPSNNETDNSAEIPSSNQTDNSAEIPSNNQTENSAEIPSDGQKEENAKVPFVDQNGDITKEPNVNNSEDNIKTPSEGQSEADNTKNLSDGQIDNSTKNPSDGQTDNSTNDGGQKEEYTKEPCVCQPCVCQPENSNMKPFDSKSKNLTKDPSIDNYSSAVTEKPILEHHIITTESDKTSDNHQDQRQCGTWNKNGIGFRIGDAFDNESEFGEFPSMVAIFKEELSKEGEKKRVLICGGSLIGKDVILTAAHCVKKENMSTLVIRAGEWDLKTEKELLQHQDRGVTKIVTHPDYSANGIYNDVALIYTSDPFSFQDNIQPICLPSTHDIFINEKCYSSGWGKTVSYNNYTIVKKTGSGKTKETGQYEVSILKKIELPIVPRNKCMDALRGTRLGPKFVLHESFICAGGEEGKDTCKGDGGSPLMCPYKDNPDHLVQVGIVAWGINCGLADIPAAYVNVAGFVFWIKNEIERWEVIKSIYV